MSKFSAKSIPTLAPGLYCYERGIYLRVTENSRYWFLKYSLRGRRRELGLGSAIGQSITQVLAKAAQARVQIAAGVDPLDAKRAERAAEAAARLAEKNRAPLFADVIEPLMNHILFMRRFTGKSTEASWRRTLRVASETFGHRRVDEITTSEIADYLRDDWTAGRRMSTDTQGRLRAFFDFCILKGWIESNPADWKGKLAAYLPSAAMVRKTAPARHHAAVTPDQLRKVAQSLAKADHDIYALCALFGMLTVGRLSEYKDALWCEIDLDERTLAVPQMRRKDKRPEPFIVPLSRQAMAILGKLDTSGEWVFRCRFKDVPIGEWRTLIHLREHSDLPITLHGFRSTFSDWCAQNEKNFIISEKCLMHAVGNQVFRAYQRDDLLPQRRKLLQEWADFLLPDA